MRWFKKEITEVNTDRGHILIGGTGRNGTTLLVQIFTYLDFETGFSKDEVLQRTDSISNAGLEYDLNSKKLPHVAKSPWFSDQIADALEKGLQVEAAIIPLRTLSEAAESRRRVYQEAKRLGKDPIKHPGTILWTMAGPNEEAGVLDLGTRRFRLPAWAGPSEEEGILARQFYKFLYPLIAYEIPLFFLVFPRFAEDPVYFYEKLKPIFDKYGVKRSNVFEVYGQIVNLNLIHNFSLYPQKEKDDTN